MSQGTTIDGQGPAPAGADARQVVRARRGPIPALYLAPWIDYGGSDKGTLDWFRWIDRDVYAPSLICTQPSDNRRLAEVEPFAHEVWSLPDLMPGEHFPRFIFDFIDSRQIEILHIMNARLAYELLPDLAALEHPPRVVVQLHVEEQTRDGYVRLVATRYGNLVDAFSVTSEHLADAIEGYDVPRDKIHVIYTGVDADEEFSPERVAPRPGLDTGVVNILYPGRLTDQKDPQLMVEVAAALREETDGFQIQVVGDGELESEIRDLVRAHGLERHVRFHPPTREIAGWYAATDLLLMTSVFEGVPYVVYEAMAMGLPIVAPALPGNVELISEIGGELIDPRDDVSAYVERLAPLVRERSRREQVGARLRAGARDRYSLRRMGEEHGALYERLLTEIPGRPRRPVEINLPPLPQIRFRTRPTHAQPLVSVIVPCFNHGRYLRECLASVEAQTYPAIETIVVDDASTDDETTRVLDEIEADGRAIVIRQPRNAGPSVARNAAIELARGRYVLPLDADNRFVEDAVEQLVRQLQSAGEQVGFVYPNLELFGNRNDYFEPPEYNLHRLLHGNYCDTSSLFDREIFDAGLRFDERIKLGHEDWDFMLTLAEHGVHGERARARTLLYRKHGFSRADVVDHSQNLFHEAMDDAHPRLYGKRRDRHPYTSIKARWLPRLTIIALGDVGELHELRRLLARQTTWDFELIAFGEDDWERLERGPHLRRLPAALAASGAERLDAAMTVAHGSIVLVTAGSGVAQLRDRAFAEKAMRLFAARAGLDAFALSQGHPGDYGWRPAAADDDSLGEPHTVAFERRLLERRFPRLSLGVGEEVGSIVRAIVADDGIVDWRYLNIALPRRQVDGRRHELRVAPRDLPKPRRMHDPLDEFAAALPSMERAVRRWNMTPTWVPPMSTLLCRHREIGGEHRIVTNDMRSPAGYLLEHTLGAARTMPFAGTAALHQLDDGAAYRALPADAEAGLPIALTVLGYLEQAAFPLLNALQVLRHPVTGAELLVGGRDPLLADPAFAAAERIATVGFVEPFPLEPYVPHASDPKFGLVGLTRAVDVDARRHRYGVGEQAPGTPAGELGSLLDRPHGDTEPVWLTQDGYVATAAYRPTLPARSARGAAKWTLAPLSWRGDWPVRARARATARRTLQSGRALRESQARRVEPGGSQIGHLFDQPAANRIALYAGLHPVTGDQLLTTYPREATDLGYQDITLLGHLVAYAPLTDRLGPLAVTVPWASRFGEEAPRG